MLTINVVTLFPEMFGGALGASILGRAAQLGHARYRVVQLRDYTHDRHRTVDDSPYGGGAGEARQPGRCFLGRRGPSAACAPLRRPGWRERRAHTAPAAVRGGSRAHQARAAARSVGEAAGRIARRTRPTDARTD